MSRGHSRSIYARFSDKKRSSLYISRQKGDHYYIQTRHNDLFSHYNLFSKLKHKFARKARIYILSEYIGSRCVLNKFNMVTVSVRKCITVTGQFSSRGSKSLVQQLNTFSQPGDPILNNPQTKLNRQ